MTNQMTNQPKKYKKYSGFAGDINVVSKSVWMGGQEM